MKTRRRTFATTSAVLSLLLASGEGAAQEAQPAPEEPAATSPEGAPPTETPPAEPSEGPASELAEDEPATGVELTATPTEGGEERPMEIVVTGSRIRRKDLTTPAPVTIMTREQFETSGQLTMGDFLQTLPEQGNAPNFQVNNGGINYGTDGGTRVNLRSMGVSRTLILVNGRRMVNAGLGASPAPDLNSIPTAAVERIEVLKDGGSAIYGSDAIAGVVNVITRRGFNGAEGTVQYGISQRGDAQTVSLEATTGRIGDLGGFLFSAGFFDQQEAWMRDRDWSADALSYDYNTGMVSSGGSSRTPEGTVFLPQTPEGTITPECAANPLCSALVASTPDWQGGFIRNLDNPANVPEGWQPFTAATRYNYASENYLTLPSRRVQIFSSGETKFEPFRGFFEASYVQRNSEQNAAPMPLNPSDFGAVLSKDSMYNPFGTDIESTGRRLVEFGHRTYAQDLATFRLVTGIDGTVPSAAGPLAGWNWDVALNYGRTAGTFTTGGSLRASRVGAALGPSMLHEGRPICVRVPGDPTTEIPDCVPMNLYGGPNNGSIDPSQIEFLGFTGISRAFDSLFGVGANATGDLFTIASDRPASMSFGYEFRRQAGAQIADPVVAAGDSADFNFASTEGSFRANEGYVEFALPILANRPGIKDLEASLASRFVHYDTFGGNFSYKLGARYTPVSDVTVRGTFSTAFRAPTVSELFLGQSETDPLATDPCANLSGADPALVQQCMADGVPPTGSGDPDMQQRARQGGNPDLDPETARVFTAGVVLQPQAVRDLSITLDYYNITVEDLIGNYGAASIIQGCYPGSSATPNQDFCDLIFRTPSGTIQYVTDVNQNVGELRSGGLDFAVRYTLRTPTAGRFGFVLDGTWLAFYERTQVTGTSSRTIQGKGNYDLGALPPFKANLGVNWRYDGFGLGTIGRFVSSFRECGTTTDMTSAGGLCFASPDAPTREVGSNVVVDAHASYAFASTAGKTAFLLGVSNVFDTDPQFVYSAALANSDPTIYDYLGRYVFFRLQQSY